MILRCWKGLVEVDRGDGWDFLCTCHHDQGDHDGAWICTVKDCTCTCFTYLKSATQPG